VIICIFGDSVVAGKGDEKGLGWPGRLWTREAAANTDLMFYNLGVNGETAADIAGRWRQDHARRVPPPLMSLLIFSFGLNDATLEEDGTARLAHAESVRIARDMLRDAQAIGPTLWIGPTPVDESTQPRRSMTGQMRCKKNDQVADYNTAYRETAEALSLPYLNLFDDLKDDPHWLKQLCDGVHPSTAGYDRIAESIGTWEPWRTAVESQNPLRS